MGDLGSISSSSASTADRLLSPGLVAVSIAVCGISVWMGRHSQGDATYFVVPLGGRGHPGVVGAFTSVGLAVVAVATFVTSRAITATRARRTWAVGVALFAAMSAEQLVGVHDRIAAVDVVARPILWMLLIVVVRRWWRAAPASSERALLIIGVALLACSELVDLYPPGDDLSHRHHAVATVLEECALSVGAWCLATASLSVAVGVLTDLVTRASGSVPPAPLPGD